MRPKPPHESPPDAAAPRPARANGSIPAAAPASGHVWLVGAGPGDPDLITLRGLRALRAADVVLHDSLAAAGLLDHCRSDALRIPVGKRAGRHSMPQEDIHALLAAHARAGRAVVRLKGGDPFIFGRGGEELEFLRARGISVTVVPGVTAASGCAAATGIPLTHRDLAAGVCLVAAHRQEGAPAPDWAALAADRQRTLVFYMGLAQAGRIGTELMLHGLPGATPAALISQGATPRQQAVRCTLARLADAVRHPGLDSPCLIVVGAAVALADPARVPWAEVPPEHGTGHPGEAPADRASVPAGAIPAPGRDARPAASPLACPA
ncbi:siroheme synthase [Castellaniella defragrans 65Phen]|uniref:uroporphyrinogen-III C-methyltransferase n=1 Tax=Castellaniella defragrans (strain DSM 12143 / CCUG 39792 / 65Phen) TaxID=1437824 RepID=W8X1W0_CASD6|nr:uroporphyrinogen-III C-methyltransferase [Castellaniella defragrans]CDM26073.1 siroheme synthase [Castellaniella defragrans 65Phen]